MTKYKHSISLKIDLIFIIALIGIGYLFLLLIYSNEQHQEITYNHTVQRFEKLMEDSRTVLELKSALKKNNYEILDYICSWDSDSSSNKNINLAQEREDYYCFNLRFSDTWISVKKRRYHNMFHVLIGSYLGILAILLISYNALKRNLLPLKELEEKIIEVGKGSLSVDISTASKDEIGVITKAFGKTVSKIRAYQSGRTLFLRNLMHELKTPILKGKLSLALMEETKENAILHEIFDRLDTLIKTSSQTERVMTQDIMIQRESVYLIDMLTAACNMLFEDISKIGHNLTDEEIECDFELFTLVLKNLIDNALKYSEKDRVHVVYENDTLQVVSRSEKMSKSLEEVVQPFKQTYTKHEQKEGFGVGLYVVDVILKKHQFGFSYQYKNENNIFTIDLKILA